MVDMIYVRESFGLRSFYAVDGVAVSVVCALFSSHQESSCIGQTIFDMLMAGF